MLVNFKESYFAPTRPYKMADGRTFRGVFYEKGVQQCPNDMLLPPGAVIVDKDYVPPATPNRGPGYINLAESNALDYQRIMNEVQHIPEKRKRGRPRKYA